jgi:signal transduction histidine kinase
LQKENAGDKIVNSKELVSKAIHDLRNLSKSLNTDSILASGLIKGIETELSIIDHSGKFKTELQLHGQATRLDPKKELILFRIVQESLNNIIKHSNANSILVKLDFTNPYLKIEVGDNGKGFDVNPENSGGLGLRNMKNRAELIGGDFYIISNSNGTIITITLPTAES